MDLKQLYREVILDHYKRPRNARVIEPSPGLVESRCKNPSCGDRVNLQLLLERGKLADIAFEGVGCAISQASTSMLTMAAKGKSIPELEALNREFRAMIVEGAEPPNAAVLGDLLSLQGVAQLHARVKCAMCGWSALEAALEHRAETNMDEDSSLPASGPEVS